MDDLTLALRMFVDAGLYAGTTAIDEIVSDKKYVTRMQRALVFADRADTSATLADAKTYGTFTLKEPLDSFPLSKLRHILKIVNLALNIDDVVKYRGVADASQDDAGNLVVKTSGLVSGDKLRVYFISNVNEDLLSSTVSLTEGGPTINNVNYDYVTGNDTFTIPIKDYIGFDDKNHGFSVTAVSSVGEAVGIYCAFMTTQIIYPTWTMTATITGSPPAESSTGGSSVDPPVVEVAKMNEYKVNASGASVAELSMTFDGYQTIRLTPSGFDLDKNWAYAVEVTPLGGGPPTIVRSEILSATYVDITPITVAGTYRAGAGRDDYYASAQIDIAYTPVAKPVHPVPVNTITILEGLGSTNEWRYNATYDGTYGGVRTTSTPTYFVYELYPVGSSASHGDQHVIAYNVVTGAWEDPNGNNYPHAVSNDPSGEVISYIQETGELYAKFTNPYYGSTPKISNVTGVTLEFDGYEKLTASASGTNIGDGWGYTLLWSDALEGPFTPFSGSGASAVVAATTVTVTRRVVFD